MIKKKNLTKIYADIIVEKESQKPIIIGKGGTMITNIISLKNGTIEKH